MLIAWMQDLKTIEIMEFIFSIAKNFLNNILLVLKNISFVHKKEGINQIIPPLKTKQKSNHTVYIIIYIVTREVAWDEQQTYAFVVNANCYSPFLPSNYSSTTPKRFFVHMQFCIQLKSSHLTYINNYYKIKRSENIIRHKKSHLEWMILHSLVQTGTTAKIA